MRNIIGASLVAIFMVGLAATPASALTFGEMQAQVQELLSRVAALTAQMNILKAQGGNESASTPSITGTVSSSGYTHRVCALLQRNLSHGMSGDDVRSMQEFLQSEGFLKATPTGYFGALTGQAIAQWQAREGLSPVGAFGPMSRERIKAWCGGGGWSNQERFSAIPTRGEAPLTVVFDTWLSGFRPQSIYYVIDFGDGFSERAADCLAPADACMSPGQNKHTYSNRGNYTATLSKITNPCAGMETLCKAAIRSEVVATQNITVGPIACTKEYKPVCGMKQVVCITAPCNPIQQTYSNRCMMEADGATLSHEGECRGVIEDPASDLRCKAWFDGCNSCSRETPTGPAMCTLRACIQESMARPYCTAYFSSSSNKPPVISGFSGPTTLVRNQTGTWSVQATDPENGQLSYSITWGDEANIYPYAAMSAERAFTQTTSFTHSYANAGTYTVTITVQDSLGETARTTTTVTVGGGNVVCTMEYAPVCGRVSGCMNTCPAGMYCAMMCQLHPVTTYSNRCFLAAAGAEIVHEGACYSGGL